jgi:hypothetical protein
MKNLRIFSSVVIVMLLTGCYSMNQQRFSEYANSRVSIGMTLSSAREHLISDGFSCDEERASSTMACFRDQQNLLPYSCIERINIMSAHEVVSSVEIPAIACAGL